MSATNPTTSAAPSSPQANSLTDRSFDSVMLFGAPLSVPSGLHSATTTSHLSASYPAFFWARHASFDPSMLNFGPVSAALFAAVRHSHFGDVFVTLTRQMS